MSQNAPQNTKTVVAIVVVYNPNHDLLHKTLASLADQVQHIVVVDNTPTAEISCVEQIGTRLQLGKKIEYIPLHKNFGIGYAQNRGLETACHAGYQYALLSDQDTEFPPNCVSQLVRAHAELQEKGERVAAIAAAHANAFAADARPFFPGLDPFWLSYLRANSGVHEISGAIASGKLINLECIPQIGLMNEPFFIDWVDFEWCWRARSKGWKVFGSFDVTLQHRVGERAIRIGSRTICVHVPQRNYYIARNGLFLFLRSDALPFLPRLGVGYRTLRDTVVSALLCTPRVSNLKMVIRGFWDGMRGSLGENGTPISTR